MKILSGILIFALLAGCVTIEKSRLADSDIHNATAPPTFTSTPTPSPTLAPNDTPLPMPTVQLEENVFSLDEKAHALSYENKSEAHEVNYREYVDWFRNYNLNIRSYTLEEYICGQYTVDMINASEKAGYSAYFAAVSFSDGTGHALVSFKSTVSSFTSWYFFEPQTNDLMTPETLGRKLNIKLGKTVTEVNIYGYFDDAQDSDPASWRFAYPLYNKKY